MVRGSDVSIQSKLGTQPEYDATIASWPAFKIKGEAWLHKRNLLEAALHQPITASINPSPTREAISSTTREAISSTTLEATPMPSTHGSTTSSNRESLILQSLREQLTQTQNKINELKERMLMDNDITRKLDFRDGTSIQADAYFEILGFITTKTEAGEALLITINNKFGKARLGYALWQWLDERAGSASNSGDGLVDADDAKRAVEEYMIPEGKLSIEELSTQSAIFQNLYLKQPAERQGLRGDIFQSFISKLPSDPFEDIMDEINTFDLIDNGNILGDYEAANKLLRKLYGKWARTHDYVTVKNDEK
jgi:hypothetical protein